MNIMKTDAVYFDPDGYTPYQFIEKIGRTCYKSEDRITETSAVQFVNMLKEKGHMAMLEHAHIILSIGNDALLFIETVLNDTIVNPEYRTPIRNYFNITYGNGTDHGWLSASFRSFLDLLNLLKPKDTTCLNEIKGMYAVIAKAYPEIFDTDTKKLLASADAAAFKSNIKILSRGEFVKDAANPLIISKHLVHTVLFTCDRGVSHEIVRHRPPSYGMESTRYCNYFKNKFGTAITVIEPCFWDPNDEKYAVWKEACEFAEQAYMKLISLSATAQEARSVLPHSVKTDIAVTANENEWQHILNLRHHGTTGAPHPQMLEAMNIIAPELIRRSDSRLK